MKYPKAYFSLIELALVISVLAILFSLLSPTLKSMAQKAEVISCTSKLKRVYLPYEMYLEDYANKYVNFVDGYNYPDFNDGYYRPRNFWRTHILPLYMGAENIPNIGHGDFNNPSSSWAQRGGAMQKFFSSGVATCPTSENFSERNQSNFYGWVAEKTGTFAVNSSLNGRDINRNSIIYPNRMLFITDAASWGYPDDPGGWLSITQQSPHYNTYNLLHESSLNRSAYEMYNSGRQLGYYLDGKANNLFVDGHIELMDTADLTFGYDGSPHYDYKGSTRVPHSGIHEKGKGFGDRGDRTASSIDFWYGGR